MEEGKPTELEWHVNALPRAIVALAEMGVLAGFGFYVLGLMGRKVEAGGPKTVEITQPDGTVMRIPYIPPDYTAVERTRQENAPEQSAAAYEYLSSPEGRAGTQRSENAIIQAGVTELYRSPTGGLGRTEASMGEHVYQGPSGITPVSAGSQSSSGSIQLAPVPRLSPVRVGTSIQHAI